MKPHQFRDLIKSVINVHNLARDTQGIIATINPFVTGT